MRGDDLVIPEITEVNDTGGVVFGGSFNEGDIIATQDGQEFILKDEMFYPRNSDEVKSK